MPEADAISFIEHVRTTPELQAEVEGLKGAGALKQLVALGAARGFHFTEAEYRKAVITLAGGELSDEALDDVRRELGML